MNMGCGKIDRKGSLSLLLLTVFTLFAAPSLQGEGGGQPVNVVQKPRCSPMHFSLDYELLYWKAKQQGLGFINQPSSVPLTSDYTQKPRINPNPEWNVGFRLGVGYAPENYRWSFDVDWTSFNTSAHKHKSVSSTEGMFPFFTLGDDVFEGDYATFAKLHWTMRMNLLDVGAQMRTLCRKRNVLDPFFVLRNAWISQTEKVTYKGGSFNAGEDVVKLSSTFYGVGPRVGIAPRFSFSNHFSCYGVGGFSAFYGFFSVSEHERFVEVPQESKHHSPAGFRWSVDFAAGLLLERVVDSKHFQLDIDLGGDYLFFNRQNSFKYGPQDVSHQGKNLTILGVHFSVAMKF